MLYEEMRLKKNGQVVRVYNISEGMATIFNPEMYQKVNNGWDRIKVSNVVPMDYPVNSDEYVSKTKKNKAKSRMQLVDAAWRTTDGIEFKHENIEEAIAHELELMEVKTNEED